MDLGLEGKRAIVTGGNRGIGRCSSLALAQEGARVCITARNQTLLDEVVGEIDAIGVVDILVNCAGAAQGGDVLTLSTDLIDEALSLKSYSYLRLSQLVIPHMRRTGPDRFTGHGRRRNTAGPPRAAGRAPSESPSPAPHSYPQCSVSGSVVTTRSAGPAATSATGPRPHCSYCSRRNAASVS